MFQPVNNMDGFMKAKYFYRFKLFGMEFLLEKKKKMSKFKDNVPSWNKNCQDLNIFTIIFLIYTGEGVWSNRLQKFNINFLYTSLLPERSRVPT